MRFSTFFANQARKPSGWFGRWIMSKIFDVGNARLNQCVYDILAPKSCDRILEIGCGTGRLIDIIARKTDDCTVEGVDFSQTMVSIAQRKNKRHIAAGRVVISKGAFDDMPFQNDTFNKICSVNTIYFWKHPEAIAKKMARLLKPGGMLVVGYEDIIHLKKRQLDADVFRLYAESEVERLFCRKDFALEVTTRSIDIGTSVYHCTSAIK